MSDLLVLCEQWLLEELSRDVWPNDGTVDFDDLAGQVEDWLSSSNEHPGDLDRNGTVDMVDFALLGKDWLKQTTWH